MPPQQHRCCGRRRLWLVSGALFLAACVRAGFGTVPATSDAAPNPFDATSGPAIVRVEPTYAGFADWNAYLKAHEPSVACEATEAAGPAACIHGGEKRRVEVPGLTSCEGLSLQESLGLFEWTCDDQGGAGPVVFATVSLSAVKGLRDLVQAEGFRPNSVFIRRDADSALLARSEPAIWGWTNTVQPLPAATDATATRLSDAGVIYTIDEPRSVAGYNLDADGIAVVTLDDTVLTWGGSADPNCSVGTGEMADPDERCLIAAGSQAFLWIEVALDAQSDSVSAERGLLLTKVNLSRVNHSSVRNTAGDSVTLPSGSRSNLVTDLTVIASGGRGIYLNGDRNVFRDLWIEDVATSCLRVDAEADNNTFVNVTATHSKGTGTGAALELHGEGNRYYSLSVHKSSNYGIIVRGNRNALVNAVLSNHRYGGFRTWDSQLPEDNIFVGILSAHNSVGGYLQVGQGTTASHVTTANNNDDGMQMGAAESLNRQSTVNQLLSANNAGYGVRIVGGAGSDQHLFSQVMAVHNQLHNIVIRTGDEHRFVGDLWVSEHANNCAVFSTDPSPGLIDGSCTDDGTNGSNTYAGRAGATLHLDVDLGAAFVGKVTNDDNTNPDDVAGSAEAPNVRDFVSFDNRWRNWGPEGPAFPHAGNSGRCLSGTCRIWDWRFVAADTPVYQVNGAFVPSQPCPASAHGDRTLTDQQDPPHTFLINAVEIVLDGAGNDNGLCESNEACIYSPNIGYYMGEDPLASQPCRFQDGRVSGVTLHGRARSGV